MLSSLSTPRAKQAVAALGALLRRGWLILALALALALLLPPVVVAAGWAPAAQPLWPIAVLAVLAGAGAGRKRRRRAAFGVLLAAGWVVVTLALAGVVRPPSRLLLGAVLHWLLSRGAEGAPPLLLALPSVDAARAFLAQAWPWYIGQGAPDFSQRLLLLLTGNLAWAVDLFLAWMLAAGASPIAALVPLGTAIVSAAVMRGVGGAEVLLFLLLALLLLAAERARSLGRRWQGKRGAAPASARAQTLASGLALTALAGLIATAVPAAPGNAVSAGFWKAASGPWAQLTGRASLGLTAAGRSIGGNGGDGLDLGGGLTPAAARAVMYVATDQPPPTAADSLRAGATPSAPMQYFVGATYAGYTGKGWGAAATAAGISRTGVPISASQGPLYLGAAGPTGAATARAAGQPLTTAPVSGERVVQQVQKLEPNTPLLYALNTPTQVNRTSMAATAGGYPTEIEIPDAASYTVVSAVPTATADELRASGGAYPAWIAAYLKQPPVPARVAKLADQWTADAATPYDKTVAIEQALRKLPYTTDIPTPPPGRDPVDYFLFTLQRGYCEYFASAMVVMLRDVGVPARIATGYATSSYDPARQAYVVTQNDAHTWVQVFFPNVGWLDFEPTPANPALLPPEAPVPALSATEQAPAALPAALPLPSVPVLPGIRRLLAALTGVLAAGAGALFGRRAWERRLPTRALLPVLFGRLARGSRLLGLRQERDETALAFGERLAARLERDDPRGAQAAAVLTALYQRARYGPSIGAAERAQAVAAWRALRRAYWRRALHPLGRAAPDARSP